MISFVLTIYRPIITYTSMMSLTSSYICTDEMEDNPITPPMQQDFVHRRMLTEEWRSLSMMEVMCLQNLIRTAHASTYMIAV